MLKRLYIRNYALIEEQEILFSERLTIITGETGAGKSILLGALGLVMGDRADTKVFYHEGEKCVVEAGFDVGAYALREFFEEHELDYDDEVVIRRELAPNGKSRAFVNDTPVNNQVLRRLTENLVDLHQQFDTLDIHNVNFQLRMIDALADNREALKTYQEQYRRFVADRKRLDDLVALRDTGAREQEFLRFQLDELNNAGLIPGEQEALEDELARLSHAEDIKRVYGQAYTFLLEGEQNIVGQLQEIARSWNSTRKVSPNLMSLSDRMENALVELQELAKDCERISDATEYNPERLAEVQDRLSLLYKLQKKHGATDTNDLMALQESLRTKLGDFTNLDADILHLEQAVQQADAELRRQAAHLSERRRAVTDGFEAKVHALLQQLAMPHARLKVDIRPLEHPGPTGMDEVQFLFASNVGSRFLPIRDVASGGELSRLTLCAKSLVADAIPLPTLIFDEIDSGVSGDVSLQMGHLLRNLAARHQVVSITHTPQVAARADRHYFVYKQVEGTRTITQVRALNNEERVRAIAVMLSGNPPSPSALKTAEELVAA
ncbi:MAG: DNA repair protein RecN [Saprospiraceae bacterium]|nr:DNA repair protein RecN [Saprospiraceae bacterium]